MADKKLRQIRSHGGRPPAPEPGSAITTWMPVSTHDKLIRLAQRQEVSVSALVRQFVILQIGK